MYEWYLVLHIWLINNPQPMLKWSNESSTIKYECEKQKLTKEFSEMINGLMEYERVHDVEALCIGVPKKDYI
jgi:hypothetical protein